MTDHAQDAGAVYQRAVREEEQGNIEQARAWYTRAIETGHPDVAPAAMLNFGVLEFHQGRPEEARAWFDRALASEQADAKAWALISLADLERRAGRIESARRRYVEAVATGHPQAAKVARKGLDEMRQVRESLAQLIAAVHQGAEEYRRSGSADVLRRAGQAANYALKGQEHLQEIPADRLSLGALLLDLYRTADDEAFLRAAAACVDRIEPEVALLPEGARPRYHALRGDIQLTQWNALHAGYGNAEVRAISLLDDAVVSLTSALEEIRAAQDPAAGRSDPLYVDVVTRLASAALAKRHWLKVRPELGQYADLLNGVLKDRAGDPASRAQCGWLLGRILWDTYAETGRPSLLLDAVGRFAKAVEEAPADDRNRPAYELKYAMASAWLARETQDQPETAEQQLADLWSQRLAVSPAGVLDSAREWADLQARQKNWAASADAYQTAVGAALTLLGRRGSPDDRRIFLRRSRGLSVLAAFALAQADRLGEAVAMLERGRGILFPQTHPEGAGYEAPLDPEAAVQEAQAGIAAGTAVAFVLSTWYGGAAIGLAPGRDPWLVDLPQLTDDEVERRLARLTAAYQSTHAPANTTIIVVGGQGPEQIRPWAPELEAVAGWSWDACMGPLIASLGACDELALIPVGTLPLLPLHAAWTENTSKDRTYAVDLLAISYAPTLRAYLAAKDRWTGFADGLALVIDDPGSAGAAPLPGAELEAADIKQLFGQVLVLRGENATAEAIKRELPRASLLHFGCHGLADLLEPASSRLLLSGEDTLSVAEIGELDLSGVRLCVLSACESAMIGVELPDEVVNLPTALAQAGAGTVVGSLWAVDDEPTTLLVGRFYRNLQKERLPPAQALRQAQRWLRDSTRAEQIAELPPDRRPQEDISPAAQRLLAGIHPTKHITDWAALVVSA